MGCKVVQQPGEELAVAKGHAPADPLGNLSVRAYNCAQTFQFGHAYSVPAM